MPIRHTWLKSIVSIITINRKYYYIANRLKVVTILIMICVIFVCLFSLLNNFICSVLYIFQLTIKSTSSVIVPNATFLARYYSSHKKGRHHERDQSDSESDSDSDDEKSGKLKRVSYVPCDSSAMRFLYFNFAFPYRAIPNFGVARCVHCIACWM